MSGSLFQDAPDFGALALSALCPWNPADRVTTTTSTTNTKRRCM